MLLCHNPPQESGSTSPFNYLSPREANHLQFTTPITRIVGPHYQKGGCGLEQRRLTPPSILHLPKEKAMTLPPPLICADFEKKSLALAKANPQLRRLSASLFLAIQGIGDKGPSSEAPVCPFVIEICNFVPLCQSFQI